MAVIIMTHARLQSSAVVTATVVHNITQL